MTAASDPPRRDEPSAVGRPEARIRRGDVVWISPAASLGGAPSIPHPHVVIQDDVFNLSRISTVIVCGITSNLKRAHEPGNVLLDDGEGSLPKRSVVVVSHISSVEKIELGAHIGSLTQTRVDQIVDGLRFQQASYFRDESE